MGSSAETRVGVSRDRHGAEGNACHAPVRFGAGEKARPRLSSASMSGRGGLKQSGADALASALRRGVKSSRTPRLTAGVRGGPHPQLAAGRTTGSRSEARSARFHASARSPTCARGHRRGRRSGGAKRGRLTPGGSEPSARNIAQPSTVTSVFVLLQARCQGHASCGVRRTRRIDCDLAAWHS